MTTALPALPIVSCVIGPASWLLHARSLEDGTEAIVVTDTVPAPAMADEGTRAEIRAIHERRAEIDRVAALRRRAL